jgi:hypothetical protein
MESFAWKSDTLGRSRHEHRGCLTGPLWPEEMSYFTTKWPIAAATRAIKRDGRDEPGHRKVD